MHIVWITHRKFDDFCATTPLALSHGLMQEGFDLTIINPDQNGQHDGFPWDHISVQQSHKRGLQGLSFSKNVKKILPSIAPNFEAAIVDWQVGYKVISILANLAVPVYLMDRSPPADQGLLASLQWKVWKKSWKTVYEGVAKHGFVVSPKHADFVKRQLGIESSDLAVVPAGTVVNSIGENLVKTDTEPWKFVYHGRLDRHRGILEFMDTVKELNQQGVDCQLTLIGDGNVTSAVERMCKLFPSLFRFKEQMNHDEILKELSNHHIGVLPMPNRRVWALASPLKRGEYLAAGLLVVGIDHSGHRFVDGKKPWMHLFEGPKAVDSIVKFVNSIDSNDLAILSSEAKTYAAEYLGWEHSIRTLAGVLQGDNHE